METKLGYNETINKTGAIEKSKMRQMSGSLMWVAVVYLAQAVIVNSLIWKKVFDLLAMEVINENVLTIILTSKGGVDLGVLGILLGIAFGGKVGQKYAER